MKTYLQFILAILFILCLSQAAQAQEYLLREAYPNVQFSNQLEAVIANNGSLLYIVEQGGKIYCSP
ncbi:thioredoxin-related protein [Pontibacter aydingkolensis]|uniref:Uncharacterized protein n=1 Tax=Pontibacter aydingkolensis TaxID=1911536 RepID=A0ABS7CSM7_9BACT|nr:hypothetical protein [Pontibacter aydingkolensis]MBW7466783.1 hypothetical protein [Pontibacter aydingkolensis]